MKSFFYSLLRFFRKNKKKVLTMAIDNKKFKKFEIEVFDEDLSDDGFINLIPKGRHIVSSSSFNDLKRIYKLCGQQIKLIRELTDNTYLQETQTKGEDSMQSVQNQRNYKDNNPEEIKNEKNNLEKNNLEKTPYSVNYANESVLYGYGNSKPCYYNIGDVEIKIENGKVYEKKWIKLSEEESSDIRVINTNSNKIINLNGKHIEVKRWILIKENDNSNTDNVYLKSFKE